MEQLSYVQNENNFILLHTPSFQIGVWFWIYQSYLLKPLSVLNLSLFLSFLPCFFWEVIRGKNTLKVVLPTILGSWASHLIPLSLSFLCCKKMISSLCCSCELLWGLWEKLYVTLPSKFVIHSSSINAHYKTIFKRKKKETLHRCVVSIPQQKTGWVSEPWQWRYTKVKFYGSLLPWWIFYFLLSSWKRNFLGFLSPPTVLQWQGCFLSRAAPPRPLCTDSPPPLSLSFKHLIHLETDLVQKISLTFEELQGFSEHAPCPLPLGRGSSFTYESYRA